MDERDTNWIIDTMKEHLKKGDFYGSIMMKIQAGKIQTIHVDRCYVKPEKQGAADET